MNKIKIIILICILFLNLNGCNTNENENTNGNTNEIKNGYSIKKVISKNEIDIYQIKDEEGNVFMLYDGFRSGGIIQVK